MSILKSAFSYEKQLPERVQALFSTMADKPTKSVEYVDEIIRAGLDGRIDLSSNFNLEGYCYRITSTYKGKVEPKSLKKIKYLEDDTSDFENTAKSGGVLTNTIIKLETSFEEIENDSELMFAVDTIKRLQMDFLVQEGISLKKLITRAIEGVPQAVKKLKVVCEEFELVGEQIKVILLSGKAMEVCNMLSMA